MFPVQVAPPVLTELGDALDLIAERLFETITVTGHAADGLDLPGSGFSATGATRDGVGGALEALGTIHDRVAAAARALRAAAAAYGHADLRAAGRYRAGTR